MPVPPDSQTFADEFIVYQEQQRRQRGSAIKGAALEEIEVGTPVFDQTLGPRPEIGSPARAIWNRAALEIGKHRVQRNVIDPYQHGIDQGDWRGRKLGREIDRAIEQ